MPQQTKKMTFIASMMMLFINRIFPRFVSPIKAIGTLAILIYFGTACTDPNLYDKNIAVDNENWNYKDQVVFEAFISDTLQPVDFYLNIRHNTEYGFRNLYLFLHTQYPSGQQTTDTLEILLAAQDGKWFGKGYGKIKENRVLLKKGVYFPATGNYIFSIEQAMREENLPGIEDIGITIKKMQD